MRNKWTSSYSVNYEPHKKAPLDARQYTEKKSDLILQSTWTGNDWNVWAYDWMVVAVYNDTVYNWLYMLNSGWADDYTDITNWKYIGEVQYIDAPIWTYIYIDFVNWDDNNDWTSWANAWKTLDRAFRVPYNWLINVRTKWDFTVSPSHLPLLRACVWWVRFMWDVTEELTNVDTTFVDKFNFSTTTDFTGIDASNRFIWYETTFWPYQWYPINSNTANTLEIAYYKTLNSGWTTVFSLNDTVTIDTRIFDMVASFYFLNYNIKTTQNTFQCWRRFRPSYSNIDMSSTPYWYKNISWVSRNSSIYSLTWCRVSNIWNNMFYLAGWTVYNSILKGNWSSRMFYGWDYLGWWWFIVEDAHDVIWSSRSWKVHIGWNYWIKLKNVNNFATLSTNTELTFFNYNYEWDSIYIDNVDYLLDFWSYEQGTGISNTIIAINQPVRWTFNNWYINHNSYKKFKYVDMSNNVAINIAWTYPEFSHNKEEILTDNSTWSIVVGNSTENTVCVVKYSMIRWTDIWEWEVRILTDWTVITDNQLMQLTNPMWVSFSSSLNWTDIQLDWTTTSTWDDVTLEFTVDRKMKF